MPEIFDVHQQWEDQFGGLLINGKVYYGKPNTDPTILANQIGIFADRQLSIALPNPQTIGADGRVEDKPWTAERYSIEVYDVNGVLNYTYPDNGTNQSSGGLTINLSNVIGINDLTAESPDGISEYADQQKFTFEAVAANTDDMTLNIDGLGAKSIKFNFIEQIKPGLIQSGQMVDLIYSAAQDNFSWTNAGRGISILTDVAGDGNDITANGGPSTTGYVDGQHYQFKPNATNSGNVTLKVGALPELSIKNNGAEIQPSQFLIGKVYIVAYNSTGTEFELVGGADIVPGRGALVYKSANQTLTTLVAANLTWNLEDYDTDSIHDNVINNSRLTVPTGVTRVKLKMQVRWANNTSGSRRIFITKNGGASFIGQGADERLPSGFSYQGAHSGVVRVVGGDYFEARALQSSGGTLDVENDTGFGTWFSMEIVR